MSLSFFILHFSFFIHSASAEITASFSLQPQQAVYYVGQVVRLTLDIAQDESELGGSLQVDGLPDPGVASHSGFTELAAPARHKRFAADFTLRRADTATFAPVITGTSEVRQRRGFATFWNQTPFAARTEPATLDIADLPLPVPEDFSGAIGDFKVAGATLGPQPAAPGDILNLRWTLAGMGNREAFVPPAHPATPDFKCYPVAEKARTPDALTFEQVVIPLALTSTHLPALTLSFFNPRTGAYETCAIGPFALDLAERQDTGNGVPRDGGEVPPEKPRPLSFTGYLAPSAGAMALVEIPAATLPALKILEQTERWNRVEYNGTSVWVAK